MKCGIRFLRLNAPVAAVCMAGFLRCIIVFDNGRASADGRDPGAYRAFVKHIAQRTDAVKHEREKQSHPEQSAFSAYDTFSYAVHVHLLSSCVTIVSGMFTIRNLLSIFSIRYMLHDKRDT